MGRMKTRPGCFEDGQITQIGLMHVLELSTLGCSVDEISTYLRVPKKKFLSWINEDSADFDEHIYNAFNEGDMNFKKRLRLAQANLADVNATMAIHLGKQVLGQTDKKEVEITQTVHVVGTLPDYGATPDQWRKQFGPGTGAAQLPGTAPKVLEVIEAESVEVADET